MIGMLLVSRSGHMETNSFEMFHYYGVHLSSSLLMQNFKSFQGKQYCDSTPVSFANLHVIGQLVHQSSRLVPHPKDKKLPDLYPLIRYRRGLLAFGRGRILILGFIRSPPTVAVCDVAHCLSYQKVQVGIFSSLRIRPEGMSHTSSTFRE